MKSSSDGLITLGCFACILACAGDFLVTFILGFLYEGYHFIDQTESFLGTSDSPVAIYMTVWEVLFCFLLVTFALALKRALTPEMKWSSLAFWIVIFYALGEGLGSGVFPYNHIGGKLTFAGKLHSVSGAIGVGALIFLPFVFSKIYPKRSFPKLNFLSFTVFFSGLFFVMLFLISKAGIIQYKGLWQRIFLANYHIFMMVLAIATKRKIIPSLRRE